MKPKHARLKGVLTNPGARVEEPRPREPDLRHFIKRNPAWWLAGGLLMTNIIIKPLLLLHLRWAVGDGVPPTRT